MKDSARLKKIAYAEEYQRWHRPVIGPEVVQSVPFENSRPFVASTVSRAPDEFRSNLLADYRVRADAQGEQSANTWLRESIAGLFPDEALDLRATDEEIGNYAEGQAVKVADLLGRFAPFSDQTVRAMLMNICDRIGVAYPKAKTTAGMAARMATPKWWRKAINRETMCRREEGAIRAGLVHSRAGKYLSDSAYLRVTQKDRRDRQFLASYEMVSDHGDVVELAEVAEAGQSNPKNRFTEMMIRARGMESVADELGWVGLFLTLTCPSRMHARLEQSGAPNPNYDGTTPRQAHGHLQTQWENVRGRLSYHGIEFMAVRVEEPHKDGTPHWHVLFFVSPRDERQVLALFMDHYLERFDPDESGARKHRVTVERISKAKGGAAAYLAKYIAKNIGGIEAGQQLDLQAEGLEPGDVMPRPAAWARVHGVRQFAFSGTANVTLWRELRRLREPPTDIEFLMHWQAADQGDFAAFTKITLAAPITLWTEERQGGIYPDEPVRVIRGVECNGKRLETRDKTWEMRRKADISAPWTRVNNCKGQGPGRSGNGEERWPPPGGRAA